MTKLRKRLISLAVLLLVSSVPVACVNHQPVPSKLESRVLSRWDALMAYNFDVAYEFFSPTYRKLFPLSYYLSTAGTTVKWLSVKITDIQFEDRRARVTFILKYELELPMGVGKDFGKIDKEVHEVWLWADGNWWYTDDGKGTLF